MAEIHEYVVFSFKDGIDRDEQIATMRELDPLLALVTGFVSREWDIVARFIRAHPQDFFA